MPDSHLVRQPRYFDRFCCVGATCEDSCCQGWGIAVDSQTWEKYQNAADCRIDGRPLKSLVEINPAGCSSVDYARMRLEGTACPAYHEGLCSIQQTFGELYIPDLCSTYPRVLNMTGKTIEMSLHLSCPEAARLALSEPDAMVICEHTEDSLPYRAGSVSVVSGAADESFSRVRDLAIEVIRERSLPLWQRILSLRIAVDKIAGLDAAEAVRVLEGELHALRQGLLPGIFAGLRSAPSLQLEIVLELVVARLGADYISPRFLDCYGEFMRGLAWTKESTMEELTGRYCRAFGEHFQPFVRHHEYLPENYLANYIFRTFFPYRRRLPNQTFVIDSGSESMHNAFLLLAAHYAIVRTLLIGMAALHKDDLKMEDAIRLTQSYSKAFLHDQSFEAVAINILGSHAQANRHVAAVLVMD